MSLLDALLPSIPAEIPPGVTVRRHSLDDKPARPIVADRVKPAPPPPQEEPRMVMPKRPSTEDEQKSVLLAIRNGAHTNAQLIKVTGLKGMRITRATEALRESEQIRTEHGRGHYLPGQVKEPRAGSVSAARRAAREEKKATRAPAPRAPAPAPMPIATLMRKKGEVRFAFDDDGALIVIHTDSSTLEFSRNETDRLELMFHRRQAVPA